jgi:Cu/Ag efflux pump CusA
MLEPLGVAVIGALFFSVPLSLIATPVTYSLLIRAHQRYFGGSSPPANEGSV